MKCGHLADLRVTRSVAPASLRWPSPDQLASGRSPGGNKEYEDLRGISLAEALQTQREEGALLDRIIAADDPIAEAELILEELEEDPGLLLLVDLGLATAVAALSAVGCVPIASCNGGAFGGVHHEWHPLVVFYARLEHLPLVLKAAEQVDVGLDDEDGGALMVYTSDIWRMPAFAAALLEGLYPQASVADGPGLPDLPSLAARS